MITIILACSVQGQYNGNENQYQSSGIGQQRPSSGHHQRTRSFSAGIRNSTITRDTKGGSLAVSSSRLVSYHLSYEEQTFDRFNHIGRMFQEEWFPEFMLVWTQHSCKSCQYTSNHVYRYFYHIWFLKFVIPVRWFP